MFAIFAANYDTSVITAWLLAIESLPPKLHDNSDVRIWAKGFHLNELKMPESD